MKAWQLIENPENWRQGFGAINKNGEPCGMMDEDVVRMCAAVAMQRAYDSTEFHQRYATLRQSLPRPEMLVSDWNDSHGHAEVVALLKELDI